jgi:hypothetical protein
MTFETVPEYWARSTTAHNAAVPYFPDSTQQRIADALERIANALEVLVAQPQPVPSEPQSAPTPEISRGDYFRKDLGERREGAWHRAYRIASGRDFEWQCRCNERARPTRGREDRPVQVSRTRPTSGRLCTATLRAEEVPE